MLALLFQSIALGALLLPQLEAQLLLLLLACVHPLHLSGYAVVSCEPRVWKVGHYISYCHNFFSPLSFYLICSNFEGESERRDGRKKVDFGSELKYGFLDQSLIRMEFYVHEAEPMN